MSMSPYGFHGAFAHPNYFEQPLSSSGFMSGLAPGQHIMFPSQQPSQFFAPLAQDPFFSSFFGPSFFQPLSFPSFQPSPNAYVYSSSSAQQWQNGTPVYRESSYARSAPGGVYESSRYVNDAQYGERAGRTYSLDDGARYTTRLYEKTKDGQKTEQEELQGLTADEIKAFKKEYKEKEKAAAKALEAGGGSASGSGSATGTKQLKN